MILFEFCGFCRILTAVFRGLATSRFAPALKDENSELYT